MLWPFQPHYFSECSLYSERKQRRPSAQIHTDSTEALNCSVNIVSRQLSTDLLSLTVYPVSATTVDKTLNKRAQQNYTCTVQLTVAASMKYRWGSLAYSLGPNLHATQRKYMKMELYTRNIPSTVQTCFICFLKQQNKTRFQKNSQISKK